MSGAYKYQNLRSILTHRLGRSQEFHRDGFLMVSAADRLGLPLKPGVSPPIFVFETDTEELYWWTGLRWQQVAASDASGDNDWVRIEVEVPAGATVILDSVPMASFGSARYRLMASGGGSHKSLNLDVVKDGAGTRDSVYSKLGAVKLWPSTDISGGNFEVSVQNAELFAVNVEALRALMV